jgi:hypothetical protein
METLRSKARRAAYHPAYQFAFTAIAAVVVGVVGAGAVRIYGMSNGDADGINVGQPARIVVVEPAKRADMATERAPSHGPARAPQIPVMQGAATSALERKGAGEAAQDPPVPEAAGLSATPIDHTGPNVAAGDSGRDHRVQPAEQPQSSNEKAVAVSQDEICKRDAAQLAHLRISQERDEVIRFERELGCEKLRPQVVRLRESVDPK